MVASAREGRVKTGLTSANPVAAPLGKKAGGMATPRGRKRANLRPAL
jgi:hypothetical protein